MLTQHSVEKLEFYSQLQKKLSEVAKSILKWLFFFCLWDSFCSWNFFLEFQWE